MNRILLICCALLCAGTAYAQERWSLTVRGGHSELDGQIGIPSRIQLTPVIVADADFPAQFDDDAISWEVGVGYRLWSGLQVFAGYADLGRYETDDILVVSAPTGTPFSSDPLTPGLRPHSGATVGEPAFGFVPSPGLVQWSSIEVSPTAWLAGVSFDRPIAERLDVFGRVAALRAEFDVDHSFNDADFDLPSESGWLWGVGLRYDVLPALGVSAGFTQYDIEVQKVDSFQLGLELMLF